MWPKTFHVKKQGELLAVLSACEPSGEMFWAICQFKPTPLFSEVEPLYRRLSETQNEDETNQIDAQLIEMGLILVDVATNVEIKYFSFFINGDTVMLRYAEPPYEYD